MDEGRNSRTNATVNELMDRYLELLDVDTTTRTGEHDCDEHCTMEPSEGLSSSSIRQIHWCLSGALNRAVRWRWIVVNPLGQAESPAAVKPDPHPPAPDQAASIVNEAFRDLPWGVLVWLAMVTGARRGELCDALGLARPGQHGDSITNE